MFDLATSGHLFTFGKQSVLVGGSEHKNVNGLRLLLSTFFHLHRSAYTKENEANKSNHEVFTLQKQYGCAFTYKSKQGNALSLYTYAGISVVLRRKFI